MTIYKAELRHLGLEYLFNDLAIMINVFLLNVLINIIAQLFEFKKKTATSMKRGNLHLEYIYLAGAKDLGMALLTQFHFQNMYSI